MSVRIKFIILTAGLFLMLNPLTAKMGTLPIGEECPAFSESIDNDSACASNDCEESNIPNPGRPGQYKWYCDCNDDSDCDIYGTAESKDWDCEDGYESGYDLDYCVDEVDTVIPKQHIKYPIGVNNDAFYDDLLATLINREVIQQKIISSIEDDINDKLAIRIPGLNFSKLTGMVDKDGYMYIPWIGEYIKAIYNYALGIISIVAVIMIILQGARIITSGGGEGKTEGLKKIGHVVIGLVIAWSSYAILYTINPALTEFKPLKIKYIPPESLERFNEFVNSPDAPSAPSAGPGFNNVPNFKQCESAWKNTPYDGKYQGKELGCYQLKNGKPQGTICTSGCGVTSLADVVKYYGYNVSPVEMARYSVEVGAREGCYGSIGPKLCDNIAKVNGQLTCRNLISNDINTITTLLKAKKPVIFSCHDCQGTKEDGTQKSYKAHYMVLTGTNEAGTIFYVNDPAVEKGITQILPREFTAGKTVNIFVVERKDSSVPTP